MPLPPAAFLSTVSARPAALTAAWDDDDWDAAYERPEQLRSEQERNARLWQDANAPQATFSILPSSSTARAVPPPAALDPRTTNGPPKLTILKRPSAGASSAAGAVSRTSSAEGRARTEKSLKEREREYAEARRRIYGDELFAPAPAGPRVAAKSRSASPAAAAGGAGAVVLARGVESLALAGAGARARTPVGGGSPSATLNGRGASSRPRQSTKGAVLGGAVRAPKGPGAEAGGFARPATAGEARAPAGAGAGSRSGKTR